MSPILIVCQLDVTETLLFVDNRFSTWREKSIRFAVKAGRSVCS